MTNWLNLPKLNSVPIQREFLMSKARFIVVPAGRRSGKSEVAFRRMARALLQQHPTLDHPKYLWGLPTEDQARNTIWGKLKSTFAKLERIGVVRYSGLNVEIQTGKRPDGTPTSSILLVRGMQNPFRVEGEGYSGIVLDEMSDQPPSAYDRSVLPAIMDIRTRGWVILIGVPKRQGVGASKFKKICDDWQKESLTDPRYLHLHWTSDLVLLPEDLEIARKQLDPKTFREQFFASWETASGLVYYAFSRGENVFTDARYSPDLPLMVGSDFNVNPMSWVIAQRHGQELFIIDEISLKDTNTAETLNVLYERYRNHTGGFVFYGDAAGRQRHTCAAVSDYVQIMNDKRFADEITGRVNIRYLRSNPAVADRAASVNAMLRNAAGERRLKIASRCVELIKDFEFITYRENSREMDKSDPKRTHMSDALGYLVHREFPMLPDKSKSKSSISMGVF